MSTGNMRRAQLVTPFGVGAMSVLVNSTSVITAGLDHWYETDDTSVLVLGEYTEHDWRLEARLRVKEFRLPPDYRYPGAVADQKNVKLTVPVLRFPRWSFCMYCKRLERSTLTMQQHEVCPDDDHADRNYKPRMSQVPFVAICSHGHLDDFPFDKWVHRSHTPRCNGVLRLTSRGGGGLEGQVVKCDGCETERSLRGITESWTDSDGEERTRLTDRLASPEEPYYCTGARPWLAELAGECGQPMRGALRAAGNVYFPKVESSIYLPRQEGAVSAELHELLRRADVGPVMSVLHTAFGPEVTAATVRERDRQNVDGVTRLLIEILVNRGGAGQIATWEMGLIAGSTRIASLRRVSSISSRHRLELDSSIVVEPSAIVSEEAQGMRSLYVALTRATKRLTIAYARPLPAPLVPLAPAGDHLHESHPHE